MQSSRHGERGYSRSSLKGFIEMLRNADLVKESRGFEFGIVSPGNQMARFLFNPPLTSSPTSKCKVFHGGEVRIGLRVEFGLSV